MIKIIPAIDLIDGKCVRLTKGDYSKKIIYNENPVEVAKEFESIGIKYLHLVDLDGAKAQRIINWDVLESISKFAITKMSSDRVLVIVTESDLTSPVQPTNL